jgi:large subunit ribosomal protein L25
MVRDVQREPVNRTPLHVDLLRVDLEQLITVEVRLVLKGDSPGARLAGGSVVQRMYSLEVEARPLDLPHQLEVDLAGLAEANSVLRAGDVPLPSNVALVTNPEAIVAAIEVAREEVVEGAAVAEEAAAAEPEVIRPARAEEEEEEK